MKKNGFTLVELLAVIILIGFIMVASAVVINNSINTASEKAKKVQEKVIIEAAQSYISEHPNNIDEEETSIQVNELIENKYINTTQSGKKVSAEYVDKCVIVTYDDEYNQYKYKIDVCE